MNVEFDDIYREFNSKILHYVSKMVGSEDAEGVTQEVFLKVSQSLDTFKGDSKLSTWIYRIATNTALDRLKSSSHKHAHEEFDPDEDMETETSDAWIGQKKQRPEDEHIRLEMNECIREFIEKLPTDHKTVMVLSEIEGLKNQEIADVLGISLENVKIRLHRARVGLKKELSKGCDFYHDDRSELACDRKETPPAKGPVPINFRKSK